MEESEFRGDELLSIGVRDSAGCARMMQGQSGKQQ